MIAKKTAKKKTADNKPKKKSKVLARTPKSLFVGDDDHAKAGIPFPGDVDESGCACGCSAECKPELDAEALREALGDKSVEATLKFYLPEHAEEFMLASRAGDLYRIIGELLEKIRNCLKYGSDFNGMSIRDNDAPDIEGGFSKEKPIHPRVDDTLEAVRKFILEELEERSIKSPY